MNECTNIYSLSLFGLSKGKYYGNNLSKFAFICSPVLCSATTTLSQQLPQLKNKE